MKFEKAKGTLIALLIVAVCQQAWAAEPDLTQSRPTDSINHDVNLRQSVRSQPTASTIENKVDLKAETLSPEKAAGSKVFISKLQVDKSSILTDAEIDAITAKYEGREVGLQDIYAAVNEINQLYAQKKNYIAKAVLLPQKVKQGAVKITLAESHIGKIKIEGTSYTSQQYVAERMGLQPGDLLNLDHLEQSIIRFNKTNTAQLKVVLVKGESFGTTNIVIKAVEPPQQQTLLFSDNAGSESTGQYRAGIVWSTSSLGGGGDNLSINLTHAKGNTGGSVSYQTPVNHFGTQLGVSYNKNQSNIISGAFQTLQIEGDSSDASISINHPLRTSLTGKLNAFIELHKKRAETSFSGAPLVDVSVNNCILGVAEQTSLAEGMRYTRIDMTSGHVDTKGVAGSEKFTKLNASYVLRQQMPKNHALLIRISGQYNLSQEKNLPSTEQFNLGGFSTVRGYKEGVLTGDRGYFISGEYHFPLGGTEGVLFLDHGGAFAHNGGSIPNNRDCYMTSAGVGVIASLAQNTMLQLFAGVPLSHNKSDDGLRIHFYLQHAI